MNVSTRSGLTHEVCSRLMSSPGQFAPIGLSIIQWALGAIFALSAAALLPVAPAYATPALSLPEQPLAFEVNQGQTSPQVAYLARGKGYMLFLKPTEAILALKSQAAPKLLSMRLIGAAPRPAMQGLAALPGRHNYYIGNDPKRWHTNIPTYGKVVSAAVYPGIDMIYHGKAGQLEYDFQVAPGADPRAIRLAVTGSDAMTVNARGDLVLKVGGEQVVHRAPYAYQTLHGATVQVDARYALHGRTVAFELGDYDHSRPLIIDPTLIYASYLGGSGDDEARAVAVDGSGNIYITGQTASTDLPQAGTSTPAGGRLSDAFITKFDSSGAVVFSTYLGSDGAQEPVGPPKPEGLSPAQTEAGEKGNAIAVSSQGNIYITGGTAGTVGSGFPTINPYHECPTTAGDVFVSVLNSNGTLHYSTCVGGGLWEEGLGIAVDSAGDAYVVGYTTTSAAPYFPTTNGALQASKVSDSNVRDSFFFKLDPTAGTNGLLYSTYLGSGSTTNTVASTYGTAVAVDSNDYAYVAGWTQATVAELAPTGFPTTNAYQTTTTNIFGSTDKSDAFVYVIDPAPPIGGNYLRYASFIGGSGIDKATGIAVDASGNIYVAGQTTSPSTDFPLSAGAPYKTLNGSSDGFVAKIHPAGGGGSDLLYSTYLGGNLDDGIQAIAVDSANHIYLTGWTEGGFPVSDGSAHKAGGIYGLDAFVTGLDTATGLIYSTYVGGNGDDMGRGIALAQDNSGKVYIAGGTDSTDLPVTGDAAQKTLKGTSDAFVAAIGTVADMKIDSFTATPDPTPKPFDPLTFSITVKNNGPDAATGVVLTLLVEAAGASSPPLDSTQLIYDKGLCTVAVGIENETFTCNLNSMGPNASLALTFSGPLTTYATVKSTATVSADQTDTVPGNNSVVGVNVAGQSFVTQTPTTVGGGGTSSGGGGGGSLDPLALLGLFSVFMLRLARRTPGAARATR